MDAREHHLSDASYASTSAGSPLPEAYPVREYVGAMAAELAQLARFNGDEALARLLDAASALSQQPATSDLDATPPSGDRPS